MFFNHIIKNLDNYCSFFGLLVCDTSLTNISWQFLNKSIHLFPCMFNLWIVEGNTVFPASISGLWLLTA